MKIQNRDPQITIISEKKFKAVIHKEKQRRKNFYQLTEISWNAVFDWAIERGTQEECRLLQAMYHAENNKNISNSSLN
ncbi:hypothetical protein [Candidatus Erwinia dacicola]|uniref:hypothetical protein n=1 Tax=Candidatus Erwinia dacicola TaxID=252393 RepID=UPI000D4BAF26|nr:hypothetical protein [Candidatus Erwinia dacicola]